MSESCMPLAATASRAFSSSTRTASLNVAGGPPFHTELCLEDAGARRKHHVGRGGCQHDEVDVLRRTSGGGQRVAARLEREVARELAVGRDVPLANAGARDDPFVI